MSETKLNPVKIFNHMFKSEKWDLFIKESLNDISLKQWRYGNDKFYVDIFMESFEHVGDSISEILNTKYSVIKTITEQEKDISISVEFGGPHYFNNFSLSNFNSVNGWRQNYILLCEFIDELSKLAIDKIDYQLNHILYENMQKPTDVVYGFIKHDGINLNIITDSQIISDIGALPENFVANTRPAMIEFYDGLEMCNILKENTSPNIFFNGRIIQIKKQYNQCFDGGFTKVNYTTRGGLSFISPLVY